MTAISATSLKFGLGLSTADLPRAVEFYSALFGTGPVRLLADFAEFHADDPPVILTLTAGPTIGGGALNHLGFRVEDSSNLIDVQHRLELAGIVTQREEDAECCYARQTKFWVPDPDANLWEVYTLDEDLDHSGFGGDEPVTTNGSSSETPEVVWGHRLTEPRPNRIPHGDDSVAEVHLEGTFNAAWSVAERRDFLTEVVRVLRPGGVVSLRGLVADGAFLGRPQFPGPASVVERVPHELELVVELQQSGLVGLQYEQLAEVHCFEVPGVKLHDLRLSAVKAVTAEVSGHFEVVYRGPLAEVLDDRGQRFPRGARVSVDRGTWLMFQDAGFAAHFTCFACKPG